MTVTICPASSSDVPSILTIYNWAVLNTTASYDYEPSTLEQRRAWFTQHQEQGLPVLVAVDGANAVIGWGALSHFRDKIGYQFTLEHSVYVAPDQQRQGVARAIVLASIDSARQLGKRILIGGLDADNEASLLLHRALGFEQVAHFKQVGYKFGRWLDLIFMQRLL